MCIRDRSRGRRESRLATRLRTPGFSLLTWSVTGITVITVLTAVNMRSLACYLTPVACVVRDGLCCPACRGDMRRPPLNDLRVPSRKPGDKGGGRGFHYVLAGGRGGERAGWGTGAAGGVPP